MIEEKIKQTLIPKSWTWTTIENLSKTEKGSIRMGPFGSQLKKAELVEKGIRVLWIENIVNNRFEYREGKFITEEKYEKLEGFTVTPGELLITMMGTIGRVAIVPDDIGKAIISSHLSRIKVDSRLCDIKYLKYVLLSENSKKQLDKESRGVVMKGLNTKIIKSLIIPLPPLAEQQRIILKVEELFSFIDAGVESLRKVRAQLKRYRQAVLKYAFEGKLTEEWRRIHKDEMEPARKLLEKASLQFSKKQKTLISLEMEKISLLPDGWIHARLGDFIYIAGRIGWRGLKADEYTQDGPLFLSVYNLNKGNIVDLSETYHISEERYTESPEIQLRNDDILLAKDGAGIGKIGIVQGLTVKASVNSSLLVIRSGCAFQPKFLFYFLKGPRMQELVKSRITGSATPHLFQRDIKKFDLLIPPFLEQGQIINEIDSRLSEADQVESIVRMSLKQAGNLHHTILREAFKGKLVPQDPNDEPATKLLERIKTVRINPKTQSYSDSNNKKSKINKQEELSSYVK